MKSIKLTNINKYFTVDDEDFQRTIIHSWSIDNKNSSIRTKINNRTISIGKFILNIFNLEIDHKDSNIFNNQKENLRQATRSQNCSNRSIFASSESPYKGITQISNGKWRARIQVNKSRVDLGCFFSSEEAALAYNEAALKYFGEFAWINQVLKND